MKRLYALLLALVMVLCISPALADDNPYAVTEPVPEVLRHIFSIKDIVRCFIHIGAFFACVKSIYSRKLRL